MLYALLNSLEYNIWREIVYCYYVPLYYYIIMRMYAEIVGHGWASRVNLRKFFDVRARCADAICASDMNGQGRKNKTHDVLPCRLRNVPAANKNGRVVRQRRHAVN